TTVAPGAAGVTVTSTRTRCPSTRLTDTLTSWSSTTSWTGGLPDVPATARNMPVAVGAIDAEKLPSSATVVVAVGAKPAPVSASIVTGVPLGSAERPRTGYGRRGPAGAVGASSSRS